MLALGALFAVSVIFSIAANPSFGYDEAVYATMARTTARGTPDTGASLVRAPALPAIGSPVARFSEREAAFRIVGLLFGLLVVGTTWGLARKVAGGTAGVLVVGVLVTSPELQLRSSQFLTDVPAVAMLLVAMLVVWNELERSSRPGPMLLAVAPLAAAAFYLRYASFVPIVAVAATAAVLWRRRLRECWQWPAAAVGLLAFLLVPHLVQAVRSCGEPWGILQLSQRWAGQYRAGFGRGLVDYARWLPLRLAGPLAGTLMLVALAAGTRLLATRRTGRTVGGDPRWGGVDRHALAFLVLPALGNLVVLGVTNRAEGRFAIFSTVLLMTAGAAVIAGPGRRVHPAAAVAVAGAVAVAFVVGTRSTVETHRAEVDRRAVLADAGRAVRRQARTPCFVVSVGIPIMTWYSGCATSTFAEALPSGPGARFVVVVDKYRLRVPPRVVLPYLATVLPAPVAALGSGPGRTGEATVYRVDDNSPVKGPTGRTRYTTTSCALPPRLTHPPRPP